MEHRVPDSRAKRALDEPVTRQAFTRARRGARVIAGLWIASVPGFALGLAAVWNAMGWHFSDGLVVITTIVSLAGIAAWSQRCANLTKVRQILAVYPWQTHSGAVHTYRRTAPQIRVPHPERQGQQVSLRVGWADRRTWRHVAERDKNREIWFAGDPRFLAVVALPGPRGFTFVSGSHAPASGEVSQEALEKAYSAGAARDVL